MLSLANHSVGKGLNQFPACILRVNKYPNGIKRNASLLKSSPR